MTVKSANILPNHDCVSAGVVMEDGRALVCGGRDPITAACVYVDPTSLQVTSAPSLPIALAGHQMVRHCGDAYSIGGSPDGEGDTSTNRVFRFRSGVWTEVSPMSVARSFFAAGVLNGKIYAVGGHGTGAIDTTTEVLDLATMTWSTGSTVPSMEQQGSAIYQGKLWVCGMGTSCNIFNPDTNTWTAGPNMNHNRDVPFLIVLEHTLYVLGDYFDTDLSVERLNPTTNQWELLPTQLDNPAAASVILAV